METLNLDKILLAFFDIQAYSTFIRKINSQLVCVKQAKKLLMKIQKDVNNSFFLDMHLKQWILSDSIIVIPDIEKHSLDIGLIDFFISMCSLLMVRGLREGLPLRGAIGTGYFYKEDDIIVSSALVDAAMYEKEQNWLGAVITPAAMDVINDICPAFESRYKTLLNFGRHLDIGEIPWKNSTNPNHGKDIPKPENGFYIKPNMADPDWRRHLPSYFENDDKVKWSDRLYGAG